MNDEVAAFLCNLHSEEFGDTCIGDIGIGSLCAKNLMAFGHDHVGWKGDPRQHLVEQRRGRLGLVNWIVDG